MTTQSLSNLRSPDTVMKLDRMGAFHQTRLSSVRSLLRKVMSEEKLQVGERGAQSDCGALRIELGLVGKGVGR